MEHVNNNLSLCLAAIAGKVDPNTIKYHNGLEYQLLKVAGMTEKSSGGGDTPSENKYTAKKVLTSQQNQEMSRAAYMVTVDLGIDSIPYDVFGINADIDGYVATCRPIESNTMVFKKTEFEGDTITFSQDDVDASYVLPCMSQADQLAIRSVRAFFIHGSEGLVAQNFKLQMFIYQGAPISEEPPAEKEMTITVTLVEDTGK